METRGERICRLRSRLNLTQAELGELCGVTRRAVSDWESDRRAPQQRRLAKLARALKTTESYVQHGDLGTYREALRVIMAQLDERLGGSTSGPDPASKSARDGRSDIA